MPNDVAYINDGTPVTCQEHYDWMQSAGDGTCEVKLDFSENEGIVKTCCEMPTGKYSEQDIFFSSKIPVRPLRKKLSLFFFTKKIFW